MRRNAWIGMMLAALCAGCGGKEDIQAKREEEFRQMMTGARLTGRFSVTGRDEVRSDSYKIHSVTKLPGGIWTINAEIPRKSGPITMPVPVRMEWAGDTAVMKLTDATLPGMGTKGHYAGFWSGGDHGGEMFGVVEK
jgi:hypothetical protein